MFCVTCPMVYFILNVKWSESCSVVSISLQPHGFPNSLWSSPGQNTGIAIPFSSGFSQHWNRTQVSSIAGRFFFFFLTSWATREALQNMVTYKQYSFVFLWKHWVLFCWTVKLQMNNFHLLGLIFIFRAGLFLF